MKTIKCSPFLTGTEKKVKVLKKKTECTVKLQVVTVIKYIKTNTVSYYFNVRNLASKFSSFQDSKVGTRNGRRELLYNSEPTGGLLEMEQPLKSPKTI